MPLRLTLCLLTLNELEGCRHDVPKLPLDGFDEVFAIDGGSTDGTVEYLTELGLSVFQQDLKGYNGSYISAFRRCSTDGLVMYHPKGSIDPAVLRKFRGYFEQGYELVLASWLVAGAVNEEDSRLFRPRKWFVYALALTAALLWKRDRGMILDVLHGCRGMRRDAFFHRSAARRDIDRSRNGRGCLSSPVSPHRISGFRGPALVWPNAFQGVADWGGPAPVSGFRTRTVNSRQDREVVIQPKRANLIFVPCDLA